MDMLSVLRTLGGLGTVLGILAAALWIVKRYDIRLPGRSFSARASRLELVESLSIDTRRSVALLRRDGQEHLILIAPEGHLLLETGIMPTPAASGTKASTKDKPSKAAGPAQAEAFGALVDQIRTRTAPAERSLKGVIGRAKKAASRGAPARPCTIGMPIKVLPTGAQGRLDA